MTNIYQNEQSRRVIAHIRERYLTEPEFLWQDENCIFRNPSTRKWFVLMMKISGQKLGLESSETVEIIDLNFGNGEALDFAEVAPNIFSGYHMNKRNWITIMLNDSVGDDEIFSLIKRSWHNSEKK